MAQVKEEFNYIPEIKNALEYLASHHIEVGIFGDEEANISNDSISILAIARIHEYGATITPNNAESLAIPLTDEAIGKSPTEFDNLFVPKGTHVLAKKTGDNDFEPMYVLMKSVEIPERSFMRAGFDEHRKNFQEKGEQLLQQAIALEITPESALDALGYEIETTIQQYMTELSEPPNSPITINNKGSSNPLIDKGHLRQAITHKIVSG